MMRLASRETRLLSVHCYTHLTHDETGFERHETAVDAAEYDGGESQDGAHQDDVVEVRTGHLDVLLVTIADVEDEEEE